jgi:hypothetical protein
MATSYGLLKAADQILDEAREVIAAEIQLKILKSSHDRLVNIAHTLEEEVGERSEEELIDMSDGVQNKCGALPLYLSSLPLYLSSGADVCGSPSQRNLYWRQFTRSVYCILYIRTAVHLYVLCC